MTSFTTLLKHGPLNVEPQMSCYSNFLSLQFNTNRKEDEGQLQFIHLINQQTHEILSDSWNWGPKMNNNCSQFCSHKMVEWRTRVLQPGRVEN